MNQSTREDLIEDYYDERLQDLHSVCNEVSHVVVAYAKRRPEMAALVCIASALS